jgi:hypothetical protein
MEKVSKPNKPPKWIWMEEYAHCSCTNVTKTKAEALGYCENHGTERRRITRLPNSDPPMELGFLNIG